MTIDIKISEKSKIAIGQMVKFNTTKTAIYTQIDRIEEIENGEHFNYHHFYNVIKGYVMSESNSLSYYRGNDALPKLDADWVANSFKEVKQVDKLSHLDQRSIKNYIENMKDCYTGGQKNVVEGMSFIKKDACEFSEVHQVKISEKLNIPVTNLLEAEKEWVSQVNVLIKEASKAYDTNRYNDEIIQCFVETATTCPNGHNISCFEEAVSECQYAMHKIGVDDTLDGAEF